MRKKWGNRIGAIVLACALTMSGLPVQSIKYIDAEGLCGCEV